MKKQTLNVLGFLVVPVVALMAGLSSNANAATCLYAYDRTITYNNPYYVTLLYETQLSREPDAPGLTYWVDLLDRCILTRDQVLSQFIKTSGCVDYVKKLYRDDLHREADADGLTYWVGTCVSGQSSYEAIGGYFQQYVPQPVLIVTANNSDKSTHAVTFASTAQGEVTNLRDDPLIPSGASVAGTVQVAPRDVEYYGQFYDGKGGFVQCRKSFTSPPQSVAFTLNSAGTGCTVQ